MQAEKFLESFGFTEAKAIIFSISKYEISGVWSIHSVKTLTIDPKSKQFRDIERFVRSLPKPALRTFRTYLNKPGRKIRRYAILLGCTERTVYLHLKLIDDRLRPTGKNRPRYFKRGKPKPGQRRASSESTAR